ncbi:MAG: hypothetical protein D3909_02585, partial [Candidatus Electrothrix sp. ATG1]|nr:hypothetical protein [Candidatus Electrothrix sp. ATG1]
VSARCYRFVAVTGYGSLAYVPEVNPMVCAASDPAPTTPVFAPGTCPQYELNTGYNKTTNTKVNPIPKQYDERWLVTRIPRYTDDTVAALADVDTWQRAVVSGDVTGNVPGSGSGNWYDSPYGNAEWISQSFDGKNETTANVDNPADDVDYLFRLDFNIDVTDPNLVGILSPLHLGLFADNTIWDVLVNGSSLRVAGDPNLPTSAGITRNEVYVNLGYVEGNHFNLNIPSSYLVPGDNSIVVHVKSGNPFIGFLMQTYADPTCGAVDYGDAPDTYGTLDDSSGPYHVSSELLRLGAAITEIDTDGQPSSGADGDDNDGVSDEDGVSFDFTGGVNADVQVANDTGADAYVCAWLDRWTDGGGGNAAVDGSFDVGDIATSPAQVCQTVANNGGVSTTFTFNWSGLPTVAGYTYARFRVCSTQSECENPTGFAAIGEVEDYRIDFDFRPPSGTIAGTVYEDTNGNSTQDAGEPGIPGVVVAITDSEGGIQTLITDANGNYAANVPAGDTIVDIDATTLPTGFTQTQGTDPTTVTVPAGGIGSDVDGFEPPADAGRLEGVVYSDTNGDGVQNPGEPGIAGVTVTITDNSGGTQVLTTDGNGAYGATVPAGATTVDIDETTLPGGSTQTQGTDPTVVTVVAGETATDIDGYQPPADVGTVTGLIYEDTNGNGSQDAGEPGIPGVAVEVTDSDGNVQTVTTDANGNYTALVPAGDTSLNVDESTLPGGSTQTQGTDITVVTVPAGGTANDVDGYAPAADSGTITGVVYEDSNGNSTQDAGEPGIPGVAVTITDSEGRIQTLITDANGEYTATVPAGSTLVDIEQSDIDGTFTRTQGTDPTTVTVPAGGIGSDIDGFAPGGIDYGDAPASYGTLHADNGPYHITGEALRLGDASTEGDIDGQPSVNADADDLSGTDDDDDGVTFYSASGGGVYADVQVVNDTGADAYVCAWLDRWTDGGGTADLDGSFAAGDMATSPATTCQTVIDNSGGTTTVTFSWGGLPAISGHTYARFRVCSIQTECEIPTGFAANGEVEDYRVAFDFTPTAVTIGDFAMETRTVDDYLSELGVERMDQAELLSLIRSLTPNQPASESDDTATLIAQLRAALDPDNDGQVALLRWDTLEERGTIGFYVHRRQGTEGDWTRINNDMLPGLITAPMGGRYMLVDPEARSGMEYQYHLIEQEATGTTRSYGPFTLKMP